MKASIRNGSSLCRKVGGCAFSIYVAARSGYVAAGADAVIVTLRLRTCPARQRSYLHVTIAEQ